MEDGEGLVPGARHDLDPSVGYREQGAFRAYYEARHVQPGGRVGQLVEVVPGDAALYLREAGGDLVPGLRAYLGEAAEDAPFQGVTAHPLLHLPGG